MGSNVLFTVLFAWFIGQCLKAFLGWHQYRRLNLWVFMEDGGLPSSHAVVLTSLTTSILYETGVSQLFAVCLLFSIVWLNDIMKFKKQQGMHSELMARFIDVREIIRRKLTESVGHTPEGVFLGILIGFLATSLVYVL